MFSKLLEQSVSFPLREYQKETFAELDNNDGHALVCMPTGAGKTLIAEYNILRAFSSGKKVIFTTPLRALSNEKLDDWSEPGFWVNQHTDRPINVLMDTGDTRKERMDEGDKYYEIEIL